MDEENQAVGSTLNQAYMARILGTNKPLTSSRYVSDSTGLQLDANAVLTQQIMTAVREEMSAFVAPISPATANSRELPRPRDNSLQMICFNCNRVGHISRFCPLPRRQNEIYGRDRQQNNNTPTYIPHPDANIRQTTGNKRLFQPSTSSLMQPHKRVNFDPSLSRYPERGTGDLRPSERTMDSSRQSRVEQQQRRPLQGSAAFDDGNYYGNQATLHVQALIDMQNEDEGFDGFDEDGDEEA